jgi:hypothetical protein
LVGEELPVGSTSSSVVPAAVPSLTHSSVPAVFVLTK